jgi:rhodanese-related sulfurtransferase
MRPATIEPVELHKLFASGKPILLDVRTPSEYAEVHVEQTVNIPLDKFDTEIQSVMGSASRDQPVYLLCLTGERSAQAATRCASAGVTDPVVVAGGTQAWIAAGLPVVRGASHVMSLERQVRIAAGSLVLLGVLLGQFVHIGFIWISGFVGASLVFAGISGICGMGLLLARMPWNQVKSPSMEGK